MPHNGFYILNFKTTSEHSVGRSEKKVKIIANNELGFVYFSMKEWQIDLWFR